MPASATANKPLLRALHGEPQLPVPFWLMRQAGRYLPEYRRVRRRARSFLELCYSPALAAEVTLQPVRRFATDGAIVFSDILVVPHGLGVAVSFREGHGPRLAPVRDGRAVAALRLEGLGERLGPVYQAVARVAAELPERVALIGFAGAPWTLATYMVEGGTAREFASVKRWAFGDPEGFQRLIEVLVAAAAEHLVLQARHGAEAVQVFDSWAGVLPASAAERWCVAATRAVVERFRAACPGVPVIGFARGVGLGLRRYAEAAGVDAVALDAGVPTWAARELQHEHPVQGNLDPVYLLAGGEAMVAETRRILGALGGGPLVFNVGHGVLPDTPPEHVALLAETVRAWRP